MLREVGIPALIGMTVTKPEQVPDLSKAQLGNSYWIADAVARPLS
jgi:hypothetical protein